MPSRFLSTATSTYTVTAIHRCAKTTQAWVIGVEMR